MSQLQMILAIAALLVPLGMWLRKDLMHGLAYALVLLIALTPLLRIQTPGNLPEITIHRLILVMLAITWFAMPRARPIRNVPIAGWIAAWAIVCFVSLLGCADLGTGIKRYLDYVFELFWFYIILATALRRPSEGVELLRAAFLGLVVVAVLAVLERYTGINVVDRFIASDPEGAEVRAIRATYRHRILLGTGMAMGWPLAVMLARHADKPMVRRLAWVGAAFLAAGCYFANSRGPWLALVMASVVMGALGTLQLRKLVLIAAVAGAAVLIARPGVYETLQRRAADTVDVDTFKGATFQYRLELWAVAYDAISESTWRMCFGFGPGSGYGQALDWSLSYRERDAAIWSWDNTFAYALYQYGFFGLFVTLGLYGSVAWQLFLQARASHDARRDLYAALLASSLSLIFMMTNVLIFASQLYYLFWLIAAVGLVTYGTGAGGPDAFGARASVSS